MDRSVFKKAKMFSWLFIVISLFGLLFIPMFPWITATNDDTTTYATEAMIHSWVNPLYDALSGMGLDNYLKQDDVSSTLGVFSSASGLSQSIQLISWSFWLALFSGILVVMGLAAYKLGQRFKYLAHITLLIGCATSIFSILILVGHVQFILHLNALTTETALLGGPSFNFSSAYFGYNYIPLLMGILLLISSILYIKTIALPTIAYVKNPNKTMQTQTSYIPPVPIHDQTKKQPEKKPAKNKQKELR